MKPITFGSSRWWKVKVMSRSCEGHVKVILEIHYLRCFRDFITKIAFILKVTFIWRLFKGQLKFYPSKEVHTLVFYLEMTMTFIWPWPQFDLDVTQIVITNCFTMKMRYESINLEMTFSDLRWPWHWWGNWRKYWQNDNLLKKVMTLKWPSLSSLTLTCHWISITVIRSRDVTQTVFCTIIHENTWMTKRLERY